MNKFFYIFPLFISASLLAQEATLTKPTSTAKKKTTAGVYTKLLDDTGDVYPSYYNTDAYASTSSQPVVQQTTTSVAQTPSVSTAATPAAATGSQTIDPQSAAQEAAQQFYHSEALRAQTSREQEASQTYDPNFNPRATSPLAPALPAVAESFGATTSSTTGMFDPYAIAQPTPPSLAVAESVGGIQSATTSSTTRMFDPYAIAQPTPPSLAGAQSVGSVESAATSSTASSATSSTTQNKQLDHTQYVEEPEIKKKARIRLMVIMQTFYTTIEDRQCRSRIKDALKEQIKILKREFPSETGIDEWFLNEAIDTKGNTMAHRAALNADVSLLEMLHEMGVDIFKQNNEKQTPQEVAEIFFIYRSSLSNEEKNALLVLPKPKKKKKEKEPTAGGNTTITTVNQYTVAELKAQEKYRQEQNNACRKTDQERYERFQKLDAFYRKIKAKKK